MADNSSTLVGVSRLQQAQANSSQRKNSGALADEAEAHIQRIARINGQLKEY
jgi:hypothetical protein